MVPLGDLCDKISDGSHNPPKGIENSKYLMISSKNVFKDHLDLTDVRYLTEEDFEVENKRTNVKANDVLLTIVGTIGRTYLVKGDEGNLVMQRSVAVLTPNSRVTPLFLMFYLHSDKNLEKEGRGNAQKGIYLKQLSQYEIKVPSIDLQKQFEAIYRQADKSEFDIEMFGNGYWEQRSLGEVGTFKRGGGFQKSDYVEHGIPCIHYGQIHTKFGPFIYSHISEISSDLATKTKFASKGDLIIAITSEDAEGSCKSTAWLGDYPVAVGGHAAIYNHCMNPLYMSFFFKSTLFNHAKMEYIHGTKVVEIKPDDIAKILVPCPPMSLQERFSAIAEQADKSESAQELVRNINYN